MAYGTGAEVMMLPALVGQQEEEEQERKQCPKSKSQSPAVPQGGRSQHQSVCTSRSPLNQPLTPD